jgi:hypothetical protein
MRLLKARVLMTRPHVTLKLATSLDGRIATASGESRWITGEAARAEVQKLRASHDAVMVGSGAARADDPELLARTDPPPSKQPLRVVLDTEFALAPSGRLFASLDRAPVLIIGAMDVEAGRRSSSPPPPTRQRPSRSSSSAPPACATSGGSTRPTACSAPTGSSPARRRG